MALDIVLLVPFHREGMFSLDSTMRQTSSAMLRLPIVRAANQLERYVARPLFSADDVPVSRYIRRSHRSCTAVTLGTHLEQAGLAWEIIDPGFLDLRSWRRRLGRLRAKNPKVVGISTNFAWSSHWLHSLCRLVREALPSSKIVIGGQYCGTDCLDFLSLDADIFCIGEGEVRLPEIVRGIKENRPVDGIPGLFVRQDNGALRFTGGVAPLDIDQLPPLDWSLVKRMDPPIDLGKEAIEFSVETQRGCLFKCEFCVFRTLASYAAVSPHRAAADVVATRLSPHGYINIVDATASSPHRRWEDVLLAIIASGGAPHPMWAFIRVSDVNERCAELMAKAGMHHVFIGQESGDQQMLNLMKKGTRVDQVRPVIATLAKYGITATFSFVVGFPGETAEMLQNTRNLILSLNEGFEDQPVVLSCQIAPFYRQDMASIARDRSMDGAIRPCDYDAADRTFKAVLETLIAGGHQPGAPPLISATLRGLPTTGVSMCCDAHRYEIFRWNKAIDKGLALFLEHQLEGRAPNPEELKKVRDTLLEFYPHGSSGAGFLSRVRWRAQSWLLSRLQREWIGEAVAGPGIVTRLLIARGAWQDFGHASAALFGFRHGTYPVNSPPTVCVADETFIPTHEQAKELVHRAILRPGF